MTKNIVFLPAVEGAVVVISDLSSLSLNEVVPTKLSLVIPAVAGLTKGGPKRYIRNLAPIFFPLSMKIIKAFFLYLDTVEALVSNHLGNSKKWS